MNVAPGSNAIGQLSEQTTSFAGFYPASEIRMRNFGILQSDLGINFTTKNTSALITHLLEQCSFDPIGIGSTGFFKNLSIGRRVECLLVLAKGGDHSDFNFPFACSGCKQIIALDITMEEITTLQREADHIETVQIQVMGNNFGLRKPCGHDQEKWAEMVFLDQNEAQIKMINSLTLTENFPAKINAEALQLIDEAMNVADPLINFNCQVTCEECTTKNEIVIDLCDAAINMLKRLQQQLIVMAHKLASHYHWSESEIFAIPHWRRKVYLDLIAVGR